MKNIFIIFAIVLTTQVSQAGSFPSNLSGVQCERLTEHSKDFGAKTVEYLIETFMQNLEELRKVSADPKNNNTPWESDRTKTPFQFYQYGSAFYLGSILYGSQGTFMEWFKNNLTEADQKVWNFFENALEDKPVYFRSLTPEQEKILTAFKFTFADIVLTSQQIKAWKQTKCIFDSPAEAGTNTDTQFIDQYYQNLLKLSGLDQVKQFTK